MQQDGWIAKALYKVKEARLKRLHAMQFHLFMTFFKKQNYRTEDRSMVASSQLQRGCMRETFGVMELLCILIVMVVV